MVELDGRTWRIDDVVDPGGDRYEVDTSTGDVLFGVVTAEASALDLAWRGAHDRSSTSWDDGEADRTDWSMGGVLWHGDQYVIDLGVSGPDPESRLVLYRPE